MTNKYKQLLLDEGNQDKCTGLTNLITYCLVGLLGFRTTASLDTVLQPLQSSMLQVQHPNEAYWVMSPREKILGALVQCLCVVIAFQVCEWPQNGLASQPCALPHVKLCSFSQGKDITGVYIWGHRSRTVILGFDFTASLQLQCLYFAGTVCLILPVTEDVKSGQHLAVLYIKKARMVPQWKCRCSTPQRLLLYPATHNQTLPAA